MLSVDTLKQDVKKQINELETAISLNELSMIPKENVIENTEYVLVVAIKFPFYV